MRASSNSTNDIEDRKPTVLPNNNLDKWLKYLIINLGQLDELDWV